ncbi:MAG: PHP domain-containing protein, partial [Armatimonadota bacterium]
TDPAGSAPRCTPDNKHNNTRPGAENIFDSPRDDARDGSKKGSEPFSTKPPYVQHTASRRERGSHPFFVVTGAGAMSVRLLARCRKRRAATISVKCDFHVFDCHVHSEWSDCAEDVTLARLREVARAGAYRFAVTDHSAHIYFRPDHMWTLWEGNADALFDACAEAGRRNCAEYIRSVREAQSDGMLVGVELDVLTDGRLVFPADLLAELDVRVGAIHGVRAIARRLPPWGVVSEYKQQARALMRAGIHVLAHPFRQMLSAGYEVPDSLVRWVVEQAGRFGVALELNSHSRFPDTDLAMAEMALDAGVRLAVGTDAHQVHELGDFSYQIAIAQEAGADPGRLAEAFWNGP